MPLASFVFGALPPQFSAVLLVIDSWVLFADGEWRCGISHAASWGVNEAYFVLKVDALIPFLDSDKASTVAIDTAMVRVTQTRSILANNIILFGSILCSDQF